MARQLDRSIRVLMLSAQYYPRSTGGWGIHVYDLAHALAKMGIHVDVVSYIGGKKSKKDRAGSLTVHWVAASEETSALVSKTENKSFPMRAYAAYKKDVIKYLLNLYKKLDVQPDIVHCHEHLFGHLARQLSADFDIPLVSTLHLLLDPVYIRWCKQKIAPEFIKMQDYLIRNSDAVIGVSRSLSQEIKNTGKIKSNRVFVVHNGVSIDSLNSRRCCKRSICLIGGTKVQQEKCVLYVGRVSWQKGAFELLTSALTVVKKHSNVRYIFIGSLDEDFGHDPRGDIRIAIGRLLHSNPQLKERVLFVEKLARRDLGTYYRRADVLVVPSNYESFSYSAVEAMLFGVPVIGTKVGGLKEVVIDRETGLLVPLLKLESGVPSIDTKQLAKAQLRVLEDSTLARSLGLAGRLRALNFFSLEKMAMEISAVYSRLIRTKHKQTKI